eukprot:2341104-Pyramimonas_sp.AAC.1
MRPKQSTQTTSRTRRWRGGGSSENTMPTTSSSSLAGQLRGWSGGKSMVAASPAMGAPAASRRSRAARTGTSRPTWRLHEMTTGSA